MNVEGSGRKRNERGRYARAKERNMRIAVYCGSSFGTDPKYERAARELGRWIGERGYSLVYGAGEAGLMGAVASEVHAAGCEVIGVIPGNIDFIRSRPQPYITELIRAEDMSGRKQNMLELADVYIALPGGIGTLDEIAEAISLTKLGVYRKKCILFDLDGYYSPLKKLFDDMKAAGFVEEGSIDQVLFSASIEEIEEFINANP